MINFLNIGILSRAQPSMPGRSFSQPLNPLAKPPATIASIMPTAAKNPTVQTNRLQAVITRPLNGVAGDVLRFNLNNDNSDAEQILAYLSSFLVQFSRMPEIRATAISLLAGITDNNIPMQVTMITNFVKSQMVYVRDPAGVEFVISPLWAIKEIQQGRKVLGDCDDHVLLLGSLLGAIGFDVRPVAVHLYDATYYDHVILQAGLGAEYGGWVDLDPCAKSLPQPVYESRLIPR
jgi:hypothetical protein